MRGPRRAYDVAALLRPLPCRMRTIDVPDRGEDVREPTRRACVASQVRAPVRTLGAGQVAALLQQRAEIEGAVLVPALLGALVGGLRCGHVSAHLVEDAEVQGGACVAEGIGFAVGELGAGLIAALFEHHAEVELLTGSTGLIDQCALAPHHLPAFLTPSLAINHFDQWPH